MKQVDKMTLEEFNKNLKKVQGVYYSSHNDMENNHNAMKQKRDNWVGKRWGTLRKEKLPFNIPDKVDILQNIREAKQMSPINFLLSVVNDGDWDYKNKNKISDKNGRRIHEDFGNYHFGVVARANGFSEDIIKRGPGGYQKLRGTSKKEWGQPWGDSPYGDDPNDQKMIDMGIIDFDLGYFNED